MAYKFYLTANTNIIWDESTMKKIPEFILKKVEERWKRDLKKILKSEEEKGNIVVSIEEKLETETFCWNIKERQLQIKAADILGIIYAFLHISEIYLGITPLWFWNDQIFLKKEEIEILETEYQSEPYAVQYRGWCIENAVLLQDWNTRCNSLINYNNYIWEMVMEALLRLGGNMILLKDRTNKTYIKLIKEMGLWNISDLKETSELELKEDRTIWHLSFDSMKEKNQKNIAKEDILEGIQKQYQKIKEETGQDRFVCYVNIQPEWIDLYEEIEFPENIIKVYLDNEYGKIIFNKKDKQEKNSILLEENNLEENILDGENGIYYDMISHKNKEASYLTMLSNSPKFIADELTEAFARGGDKFLLINCSNIKPHVFYLDFIARLWKYGTAEPKIDSQDYIKTYYGEIWEEVYGIFETYHRYMLNYDKKTDTRAGDQFYHHFVRKLANEWLKSSIIQEEISMEYMIKKADSLKEQIKWLEEILLDGVDGLLLTYQKCYNLYEKLQKNHKKSEFFYDSIYLQASIHHFSGRGALQFCRGFDYYIKKQYEEAFTCIGRAIELFECILEMLERAQHDKWEYFYQRDYITDIRFSIYCLEGVRHFIRNLAEGPEYEKWEKKYLYKNQEELWLEKRKGHLDDRALYQKMKDELCPMGSWYVKVH